MQERLIIGAGTREQEWQAWEGLHQLPLVNCDELVPPAARTVVISPHPDDEVLATGGLLAMLAQDRRPVAVIAVTDGDASHLGSKRWPAPLLAEQRHLESVTRLGLMGLPPQVRHRLQVPDGQVRLHLCSLIKTLERFLRPDDVVISTWELDGHPDHEATSQATAKACACVGALHVQVPIWMWHWALPADSRVPWHRMVRLALSTEASHRKKRALAAHETQLMPQDTGRAAVLEATSIERMLRPFEFFILPSQGPCETSPQNL